MAAGAVARNPSRVVELGGRLGHTGGLQRLKDLPRSLATSLNHSTRVASDVPSISPARVVLPSSGRGEDIFNELKEARHPRHVAAHVLPYIKCHRAAWSVGIQKKRGIQQTFAKPVKKNEPPFFTGRHAWSFERPFIFVPNLRNFMKGQTICRLCLGMASGLRVPVVFRCSSLKGLRSQLRHVTPLAPPEEMHHPLNTGFATPTQSTDLSFLSQFLGQEGRRSRTNEE